MLTSWDLPTDFTHKLKPEMLTSSTLSNHAMLTSWDLLPDFTHKLKPEMLTSSTLSNHAMLTSWDLLPVLTQFSKISKFSRNAPNTILNSKMQPTFKMKS
ncbi:hypothetical protein F511_37508 [Dorcoceras hygrometricum]|uniref:Uncharacterized protein n=1 Tax=Dorcoceras hygrometricum TaxID=472368 RepID=A0A2Z7CLK1_9LAMI|nr:hypothetical protein F511_37508 [Dorcoceras hygrometricum]